MEGVVYAQDRAAGGEADRPERGGGRHVAFFAVEPRDRGGVVEVVRGKEGGRVVDGGKVGVGGVWGGGVCVVVVRRQQRRWRGSCRGVWVGYIDIGSAL